jgi:hypothetical protein
MAAREKMWQEIKTARRKFRDAERKLESLLGKKQAADTAIPGGPVGLRGSGVGIVRVGSHPRAVRDSTAVNRRRRRR